jgi:hypothetical protein
MKTSKRKKGRRKEERIKPRREHATKKYKNLQTPCRTAARRLCLSLLDILREPLKALE